MKTYAAIQAEIARLQRQAESARKTKIAGVVGRIKEAIAAYGLTADELGFGARRSGQNAVGSRTTARTSIGVPKYRDPASGKTWTGRGKPPLWIVGVKDRDPFLIADTPKAARNGRGTKKRAGAKRRKTATPPARSAAVQIESGAAE